MGFLPPKFWKPGEQYSPADFNAFVKNNLENLVLREAEVNFPGLSASDETFNNTAFAAAPSGITLFVNTLHIINEAPGVILFSLMLPIRVSTTNGRVVGLDIYWVEKDQFLSTLTNTPATNGLWSLRTTTAAENMTFPFTWLQGDIPIGDWNFELWVRVNADTATLDLDQLPYGYSGIFI